MQIELQPKFFDGKEEELVEAVADWLEKSPTK